MARLDSEEVSQPPVTREVAASHGLSQEEYEKIRQLLGGSPTSPRSASSP